MISNKMWENLKYEFSLILSVSVYYIVLLGNRTTSNWSDPPVSASQLLEFQVCTVRSSWSVFVLFFALKLTVLCSLGSTTDDMFQKKRKDLSSTVYFSTLVTVKVCKKSVFYMKTKKQDMGEHIEMLLFTNFFKKN